MTEVLGVSSKEWAEGKGKRVRGKENEGTNWVGEKKGRGKVGSKGIP